MKAADCNQPQAGLITERIFDHVLLSRRTYTVTAVDFAKRQISYHKNSNPYWVELNQIAAIS